MQLKSDLLNLANSVFSHLLVASSTKCVRSTIRTAGQAEGMEWENIQ